MKKLFVFINIIMLCSSSLYAAEFCVYNPNSVKIKGIASIELGSLRIKNDALKLSLTKGGKELPWQIINKNGKKILLTALELKAFESVRITVNSGHDSLKSLIRNNSTADSINIDTSLYAITMNRKKGYMVNALKDKQSGSFLAIQQAGLFFKESGEQLKYNGHFASSQKLYYQSKAKVSGRFIYKGKIETQLELSWKFAAGTVRDIITFNGINRLVRHNVTLNYNKIMVQGEYRISLPNFSSSQGEGTVFPQQERYPERTFTAPGYEFAYNQQKKQGIGFIAPSGQPLHNFFWQFSGKLEGRDYDRCIMSMFTEQLRYTKLPGKIDFSFALIAGGTPSEAADYSGVANSFREFRTLPVRTEQGTVKSIKLSKATLLGVNNTVAVKLSPKTKLERVKIRVNNRAVVLNKANSTFNWQPVKLGSNKINIMVDKSKFIYDLNVKKVANLKRLRLDKLINKPDKPANTTVLLTNNANSTNEFKLVSSVIFGIARREVVNTKTVIVEGFASKKIVIPWDSGVEKKGITFEVKLYHNGKLEDIAREYGAITSFIPDAGQYSVANPGWFKTMGQEKIYIKNLRNNYFGFFEFYCWTKCPMTGLTPKEAIWDAQTESQVAYEAKISKKFVKNFVKVAHDNGLAVFPWMNGEVSLPTGLDHPEYYRYSKTGQPLLYNGTIRNGKRYAIAYTSVLYNPKVAYKWGQLMGKSIDMFGWDGCRFDWAFTPSQVGDPMRAQKSDWYNHLGVSSRKLYPDQDVAGTKALQAFRKGVAETHPEFIYGTNSGRFSPEVAKRLPKYKNESSSNSWIWFEYLLEYNSEEFNTWQKWSKHLTEDSQLARPNGAQIGVGWQRMYPSGAVSGKLIPYIILYSGLHWIGVSDRNESLGENWKMWRFAMRYSKYFYGKNFKLMPMGKRLATISVLGSPRLFWKQWIFMKKSINGRSLLVNMINLPKGDYISERHEPPKPQKNIVLIFNKRSNEKIKQIVMLNVAPVPHSVQLKPTIDGNKVTVVIPEIIWGTSILIETKQ
jgi:hypothetical protein